VFMFMFMFMFMILFCISMFGCLFFFRLRDFVGEEVGLCTPKHLYFVCFVFILLFFLALVTVGLPRGWFLHCFVRFVYSLLVGLAFLICRFCFFDGQISCLE